MVEIPKKSQSTNPQVHLSHEKKNGRTFHDTGWLIEILMSWLMI